MSEKIDNEEDRLAIENDDIIARVADARVVRSVMAIILLGIAAFALVYFATWR